MTRDTATLASRLTAWSPALTLVILSGLLQVPVVHDVTQPLLQYQRDATNHGEVWRLLSGHLLHLSWSHWLLNVAALVMIWELFFSHWQALRSTALLTLLALGVAGGLWGFNPNVHWYVGLSGVLHGLLVVGVCQPQPMLFSRHETLSRSIILLALAGKLLFEHYQGPASGWLLNDEPVITAAHAYGAITGVMWSIGQRSYKYCRSQTRE